MTSHLETASLFGEVLVGERGIATPEVIAYLDEAKVRKNRVTVSPVKMCK